LCEICKIRSAAAEHFAKKGVKLL